MGTWIQLLLSTLLIVWMGNVKASTNNGVTECSLANCQQLQDRLDTLEAAVKSIVSALASQTKGSIVPVNKILEKDPALRAISSSPTTRYVPHNSTYRYGISVPIN